MTGRKQGVDHKSPGYPRSSFHNDRYSPDEAFQPPKRRRTNNIPDTEMKMNPARRSQLASTGANTETIQPSKTRTRNDRKTNRSSRIHSIRNLLARGDLPLNTKIEKARELAGLLFDQQKDKLAKETAQMITKYHKIRFFERRKAERNLRRLTKERDAVESTGAPTVNDVDRKNPLKTLDQQIREARIDLNYTLYSPLTEKYISLFADGPKAAASESKDSKARLVKVQDQKLLSTQQSQELETREEDNHSPMNTSDYSTKPRMWHEVERIMYPPAPPNPKRKAHDHPDTDINSTTTNGNDGASEEAIKKQLSLLREGKLTTSSHSVPHFNESNERHTDSAPRDKSGHENGKTSHDRRDGKRKREAPPPPLSKHVVPGKPKKTRAGREARIDESRHIPPTDVDSAADAKKQNSGDNDSDSDGDGGFFER